jgi:hypothetical protein
MLACGGVDVGIEPVPDRALHDGPSDNGAEEWTQIKQLDLPGGVCRRWPY